MGGRDASAEGQSPPAAAAARNAGEDSPAEQPITEAFKPAPSPEPVAAEAVTERAVVKVSKPRIDAVDGCRFALVLPIIIGHFIKFGTERRWLLKLMTQENVLVGGFFIISGYVTAYTSTNMRERSHDKKKLANPELFFWQKVMSYYPLHFLVSTAFAPMFIWVDRMTNAWSTTGVHALLNYSLMQAWFPSEAEIWNPPIWFLSSMTFANACMPLVLPPVSRLSKGGLSKLQQMLTALSILGKVSYSQAWQYVCRGNYTCRPSLPHLWNVTRFHPFWALVDILMGVTAVRDVMLDDEVSQERRPRQNPLFYFVAAYASLALRLTRLNLNDAMIRCFLFMPLYIRFLKSMHRDSLSERPATITRFFGSKAMTWLGSLAFPMFVLHGPIGQLFYKRKVAVKLWGHVMPKNFFIAYLLIVVFSGHCVNELFVKSKLVQRLSGKVAQFLANRTAGMLSDVGDAP